MSECPLCCEDETCPGRHCLVEVADVVAFVRAFDIMNCERIADAIEQKYDWPPRSPESRSTER